MVGKECPMLDTNYSPKKYPTSMDYTYTNGILKPVKIKTEG